MIWKNKKQAMDNYKYFKAVIRDMSYSQGYYGRILREIVASEQDDCNFAVETAECLPDFKGSMYNVCAYLEGF